MQRLIYTLIAATGLASPALAADAVVPEGTAGFKTAAESFIQNYCVDCHDADVQKAKFRIDDIDPNITDGKDIVRWQKVLEMVEIKNMPPEKKPQPDRDERRMIVEWITGELEEIGQAPDRSSYGDPQYGNRLDHQELFSGEFTGPSYTKPRAWRMSSRSYDKLTWRMNVDGRQRIIPFEEISAKEFKDYANGVADLGSIQTLYSTCEMFADRLIFGQKVQKKVLAEGVTAEEAKKAGNKNLGWAFEKSRRTLGDVEFRHGAGVFKPFATKDTAATDKEMQEVLLMAFDLLLQRPPTAEETQRYVEKLMKPNIELVGNEGALKSVLVSLMMSTEFVFRMELGLGEELADGRRLLAPREMAYALAFALTDRPPDQTLMAALNSGKLETANDFEREARRMLSADPGNHYWDWLNSGGDGVHRLAGNSRILRFFQEFFGYAQAVDVFKDKVHLSGRAYEPRTLQIEADVLVLDALAKDKHVFETMLTTDRYAVALKSKMRVSPDFPGRRNGKGQEAVKSKRKGGKRANSQQDAGGKHLRTARGQLAVYNLDPEEWINSPGRFTTMPEGQRAGILTHPAWLASFSSNFENDPIRRGKWIREKLLAGMVPNVPIGVDANVPEDHTKTLRERYRVTEAEQCWRCHKKMNPLGNVFEAYDDVGMYRTEEPLGTAEAFVEVLKKYREANKGTGEDGEVDPNLPVRATKAVAINGAIDETIEPALHGEVKDPVELAHKLAKSPLVRQSILRHAFRYFMGRNETLDDSPTLMAMDKAYVDSDGSFNETLVTLLTSDSFLYRK